MKITVLLNEPYMWHSGTDAEPYAIYINHLSPSEGIVTSPPSNLIFSNSSAALALLEQPTSQPRNQFALPGR